MSAFGAKADITQTGCDVHAEAPLGRLPQLRQEGAPQFPYDRACQSMHDTGQPYIVSEIIALNIIALAKAGERNPDRLCEGALKALPNKAVFETKSRR